MLIEKWEHFKGYDRWPEVEAAIESETNWSTPAGGAESLTGYVPVYGNRTFLKRFHIQYHGPDGSKHNGSVWSFLGTGISILEPGDKLYIRCSPENPNRIYLRDQTTGVIRLIALLGATGLLVWVCRYLDSR